MLPDALRYDRYGSFEYIRFLLEHTLSSTEARSLADILRFCEEKSTLFAAAIPATLALLEYASIVNIDLKSGFIQSSDINFESLRRDIIENIFSHLGNDGQLSEFIQPEAIEYDSVNDTICLRNNLIPLEYSGLKNLLISLDFFKPHSFSGNLLQVTKERESYFETRIIPNIKMERFPNENLRNLSLASLMRMQELNELYGREAEEFVLEYERRRLGQPAASRVRIISDLQCDAGYDIASFETAASLIPNRFIEVKSFNGNPTFFWSRNEVAISEIKGAQYYLYLVNRNEISREDYVPMIIANPHTEIFLNEKIWNREAQSWFFRVV